MFLKFKVQILDVPGKLVRKKRGGQTFVEFEIHKKWLWRITGALLRVLFWKFTI